MATRTVRLKLKGLLKEPVITIAHGKVHVALSPSTFDVPVALTAELDKQARTLHVTLSYVDDEKADERQVDDFLALLVGKKSGKLIGFRLKSVGQEPQDIKLRIIKGVEQQMGRATRDNQRLNYNLVKDVVSSELEPLLAAQ